jgi:hypothetical protein
MFFRENTVTAARADDDDWGAGLGGGIDDEFRDEHISAVRLLVKRAARILSWLECERLGRWGALPDSERGERGGGATSER